METSKQNKKGRRSKSYDYRTEFIKVRATSATKQLLRQLASDKRVALKSSIISDADIIEAALQFYYDSFI